MNAIGYSLMLFGLKIVRTGFRMLGKNEKVYFEKGFIEKLKEVLREP